MISEIICFLYLLIPMWFTPRANQIYTFMRSTIFFRAKKYIWYVFGWRTPHKQQNSRQYQSIISDTVASATL